MRILALIFNGVIQSSPVPARFMEQAAACLDVLLQVLGLALYLVVRFSDAFRDASPLDVFKGAATKASVDAAPLQVFYELPASAPGSLCFFNAQAGFPGNLDHAAAFDAAVATRGCPARRTS